MTVATPPTSTNSARKRWPDEAATKTAMSDVVKMHTVGEPDAQSEAVADEDVADAETKVEDSDSNDGAKNSGSAGGGAGLREGRGGWAPSRPQGCEWTVRKGVKGPSTRV